jgi:hypothetical protein
VKIVYNDIKWNEPSIIQKGETSMDLQIPIRVKKDTAQFTVELDHADRNELLRLAKERNLKFHTFVKAILLSYLKYVKEN